jgi:hypothetical protein
MKLTEDKYKVVKRGEIALSQLVVKNNFTHAPTSDLRELPKLLAALPFSKLKELASELIFWQEPRMKIAHTRAFEAIQTAPESDTRDVLEKLILTVVTRYGAPYAVPRLMIEQFGFQFLKKLPAKANKQNSDTIKQVAETLSGPLGETINREVDAIRTAKHYN